MLVLLLLVSTLLSQSPVEVAHLTVVGRADTLPLFFWLESRNGAVDLWHELVSETEMYPSTSIYRELTITDTVGYVLKRVHYRGPCNQYPEERIETFLDSGTVLFVGTDSISLQSAHK